MVIEKVFKSAASPTSIVNRFLGLPGRANDITTSLIPVGDTGLYRTPDEPADPFDCARFPDSPYCGGIPFRTTPFQIEPELIRTNCDLGIRLNATFAFVRVPPVAIVYRKESCREVKAPQPIRLRDLVIERREGWYSPPKDFASKSQSRYVVQVLGVKLVEGKFTDASVNPGRYRLIDVPMNEFGEDYLVDLFDYPYRDYGAGSYELAPIWQLWDVTALNCNGSISRWSNDFRLNFEYTPTVGNFRTITIDRERREVIVSEDITQIEKPYRAPNKSAPYRYYPPYTWGIPFECSFFSPPPPPKMDCCCPQNDELLKAIYRKNKQIYQILGGDRWQTDGDSTPKLPRNSERAIKERVIASFDKDNNPKNSEIPSLIELIEQVMAVAYMRIGLEELPAKLPKRLIYPRADGDEKIDSVVEWLGYQVKQIDRAIGYLPQKIKIADTNPGVEGNQSVEIEIHSIADFVREVLQSIIDTNGDVDVANNMLVRLLMEAGLIHQFIIQNNAMTDAIVEHLDFKQGYKKIKAPFAFNPKAGYSQESKGFGKPTNVDKNTEQVTEDLLPKLLKNTEMDIRILVNQEKMSLNDLLQDIKKDTALAAGAVTEKATPKRLEELVNQAQALLKMQSIIDRDNSRKAMVSGKLRTRKQ